MAPGSSFVRYTKNPYLVLVLRPDPEAHDGSQGGMLSSLKKAMLKCVDHRLRVLALQRKALEDLREAVAP
jgi:hypothetical protein